MAETQGMQKQLDTQRRKVDVDNLTMTVRELLSMVEHNELRRAPAYQRKFRWDEEAESRLIESVLLGLPIPNLFFATNDDGTWEVVDGLQRISTLIHFASSSSKAMNEIGKDSPLLLQGLRKLDLFNGLSFQQLPVPVQLAFTKRGFGITALSDKSDPVTRFDTFERLNRGAVALTSQEVRACIYEGPFNKLLRELAYDEIFRSLVKLQRRNEENATREELVLKFFAYYFDRASFEGAVADFLNNYMQKEQFAADIEAKRALFLRVAQSVRDIVDGPFLRTGTGVTPQNQLEAVLLGAAQVLESHERVRNPGEGWLNDPELVEASTGATNTRSKLNARIRRAAELLTPDENVAYQTS
jgi:hypothetical protein